jgi:hypothetical protein
MHSGIRIDGHTGKAETFVEHRHQHGAAADPENARQKPGQRAGRHQQQQVQAVAER